jgi:phage protein D
VEAGSIIMTARKATVRIIYNGADISGDIAAYLIDFEYNDNESGKADDIQISLEDRNQLWLSGWLPKKTDTITATILVEDWFKPGEAFSLPCGTFQVDEIEHSGPPHIVRIKAISVPVSSAARGETKTRAWEKISLREIAADIGGSAGLALMYESEVNPQYLRVDQLETSDLAFLQQLCDKACLSLKVTDNQIVIFDERTYEANDAIREIERDGGDVIRFSFRSKSAGTAKRAIVSYADPLTGKTVTGEYEDPDSASGVTLNINDCPDGDYADELGDTELDPPEEDGGDDDG